MLVKSLLVATGFACLLLTTTTACLGQERSGPAAQQSTAATALPDGEPLHQGAGCSSSRGGNGAAVLVLIVLIVGGVIALKAIGLIIGLFLLALLLAALRCSPVPPPTAQPHFDTQQTTHVTTDPATP